MRIVMAVSKDGFMSREPKDPMDWLGPFDRAVFRLLTSVGGELAVGALTAASMPRNLVGRNLKVLTRGKSPDSWGSLEDFYALHPDGWLIGGQTIATEAIQRDMVTEVHLCRSDRFAWPCGSLGQRDEITPYLESHAHGESEEPWWWHKAITTRSGDTAVDTWRKYYAG